MVLLCQLFLVLTLFLILHVSTAYTKHVLEQIINGKMEALKS